MSQYPVYPTQLSYCQLPPGPALYPGYPASYMSMLPAMSQYLAPTTTTTMSHHQQQHQVASTGQVQVVTPDQGQVQVQVQDTVTSSVGGCEGGAGAGAGAGESSPGLESDRQEYVEELSREREAMDQRTDSSHAKRLIDREISLVQSGAAGLSIPSSCETQMVDVYREKPIRLVVKVTVPVKEHPKFNFVGKLLGPKGNSLKRLQEETLTKMAVLGKGSMRDKAKEEEMRVSKDPKYHHLNDELHVEIVAFAPPAEAHARMSYALTEVRKYLIPDSNDTIRQLQMKELEILNSSEKMLADPGMALLKTVPMSPMSSMQPLLVPTTASPYLSSPHLSLLPTPPLEAAPAPAPTIAAPPTKYETQEESQLKMQESKRAERRRDTQPY